MIDGCCGVSGGTWGHARPSPGSTPVTITGRAGYLFTRPVLRRYHRCMRTARLWASAPRVRKAFQPAPRPDRQGWLFAPRVPDAIWRICGQACVAIIVVAVGSACSRTSPLTVIAQPTVPGPVSHTSNPACLLKPDQIKAVLGSAPAGPWPGKVNVMPGYYCFYGHYSKVSSFSLAVYSLPGISEQEFQENHFPIPGLFLPLPPSVPGLERVSAAGIGSEAFLWNDNTQSSSAVEFRRAGNIVVVFLMTASISDNYRATAAIELARDAASATVS